MDTVTRNVIADLWPLYVSDDVSPDTRRLVDAFLASDPEFARTLHDTGGASLPGAAPPTLPPDLELKTLDRVKRKLTGPKWIFKLALIFSGLAFARIISDTSFDVSPRAFIATAIVAAAFWIAFFVVLFRGRRSVLVRLR
jgi:anti-sigma factor RsiW